MVVEDKQGVHLDLQGEECDPSIPLLVLRLLPSLVHTLLMNVGSDDLSPSISNKLDFLYG